MILNRSFAGQVVNAGFSYVEPQGDSTPDAIAGQTLSNVQLTTLTEFAPVQITGIDTAITASITGGEMAVSTDGTTYGAFSSSNQSIENGYWIIVRATSSATNSTSTTATLSAGGISAAFVLRTVTPITIDYIPRLLSTDINEVSVFVGRGNRFNVTISHNGTSIDLSEFTRFELFGLTDSAIDSDSNISALDWSDGDGVINIDVGEITTKTGSVKTTLIAYSDQYPEGVVLWHPQLAQSHVTVNIFNA